MIYEILVGLLTLAAFVLFIMGSLRAKRPPGFPPGPTGLPIIGNILQLGIKNHQVAMKLEEKYGPIIGFRIGSHWSVFLNNPEDIREVLSKPELTGKTGYNLFLDEKIVDANHGLITSYGQKWLDLRRFSLRTLRDFGFGRRTVENIIMEEVRETVANLKKMEGQPMSTGHIFNPAVFNVIWSIVAAERFPHDDPRLNELIHLLTTLVSTGQKDVRSILLFLFPSLLDWRSKMPLLFRGKNDFRDKLFGFLGETIRKHEETLDEGSPRDFIDTFLIEKKKTTDQSSSFYGNDSDMDLIVTLMDLFIAGSETTSNTLCWSLFLLALHPEVQSEMVKELETVVGQREVSLTDKPNLTYVEATTLEIMRVSSLVPIGTTHTTTEEVTYKGFTFPKNTIVAGNLYAAHFSPSLWTEPKRFNPERFLSPDRKSVTRSKSWMPFGVGRRSCMGETLARDEFFLFFTNLVQNFRIRMPENEPEHSIEGVPQGPLVPEPHSIILEQRQ